MLNSGDELARALRENEMLAAENERLLLELREATEKYQAMRASLSWKITGPLRRALDLLTRPAKIMPGPMVLNNENYQRWIAQYDTLTNADRSSIRAAIVSLKSRRLFSLLLVVRDAPAASILQTIQSIRRQLYREWEICIVDDASTLPHVARALASCGDDPRVRVTRRPAPVSEAAKKGALNMARGEFVAFLQPGDMLAESALFEIAAEVDAHPDTGVVYSDEDSIDASGRRSNPRFKTDWNPDLFHEQNYLGRLLFSRSRDGNPASSIVRHVPSILCHYAADDPQPVVRKPYSLPIPAPLVSVIIPTRDRADLLERCLEGLLHRTAYPELEIIIVDNDSREEQTRKVFVKYPIRLLPFPGEFNWAAMNNAAARSAGGQVLLFLNNDTDVIAEGWLRELAAHAMRNEVGAVGAKLLFADQTVQHAGIWLGPHGFARHLLRLSGRHEDGYLGQLSITRNLSAVTGACMAVRRELFLEVGGFDESFPVSYNDLDFCLRLAAHGFRIVWTPHAELLHLESASRGSSEWRWRKEEADYKRFYAQWKKELDHDPFFNPNLDLIGEEQLALACPPRVRKPWQPRCNPDKSI